MNIKKLLLGVLLVICLLYLTNTLNDIILQILVLIGGFLFIGLFFEFTDDVSEVLNDE